MVYGPVRLPTKKPTTTYKEPTWSQGKAPTKEQVETSKRRRSSGSGKSAYNKRMAAIRAAGEAKRAAAKVEAAKVEAVRVEQVRVAEIAEVRKDKIKQNIVDKKWVKVDKQTSVEYVRGDGSPAPHYTFTEPNTGFNVQHGTRTIEVNVNPSGRPIYTKPYVEKRIIGSTTHEGTVIPITETVHVDPTVEGKQSERKPTASEQKQFDENQGYFISSKERTTFEKIKVPVMGAYHKLNQNIRESITEPTLGKIDFEKAETISRGSSSTKDYLLERGVSEGVVKFPEIIAGAGLGVLKDIKDKPLKHAVILAATAGAGFVATGVSATGTVATAGINIAGAGAGLYFGGRVLTNIDKSLVGGDYYGAGSQAGVFVKDIAVGAVGVKLGSRGANILIDKYRTKFRTDIPIEDVGYGPITEVLSGQKKFVESSQFGGTTTAGFAKQQFDLSIFQKAGRGYHVTPANLGKGFSAGRGTSEFAGLYVAPAPSIRFARTGESGFGFGWFRGSKPTIARIYGQGYNIKGLNTDGSAFVTGVKPEIEAVYSMGTLFKLTGQKTFTKFPKEFGGRSVPIDTFQVVPPGTAGGITPIKMDALYGGSSASGGVISSAYPITNIVVLPFLSSSSKSSFKSSTVSMKSLNSPISSSKVTYGSSYRSPLVSSSTGGSSRGGSSYIPSSPVPSPSPSPSEPIPSPSPSPSYPRPSSGGSSFGSNYNFNSITGSLKLPKMTGGRKGFQNFGVSVKKGGAFRNIGYFGSMSSAFGRGLDITKGSSLTTFKLTGIGEVPSAPKGYKTKKTDEGLLFIQNPKKKKSKSRKKKK